MPKFKVGDVVDYEDINESGARFWSTNWKVITVTQDGYRLRPADESILVATTFQPFWAESKMRLSEPKPKYGRTAAEVLEQETAPVTGQEPKEELLSRMMLLLGVAGLHRDVSNTLRAGMYAAYTTIDSADGRRVFVQDFAASLNRNGLLSNDKVDEFTRLGYEFMEASE